jgi:hypothetical protein
VLIIRCDVARDLLYSEYQSVDSGKPSDFYYLLPEKFFTMYETLMTTRFSPFVERFEEFSLRIFESGIKQHWQFLLENFYGNHQQVSVANESDMLKMGDLKYVFYLWAIGIFVAIIAFMAELLCHKYRARIRQSWFGKVMRKFSWEERRERREREEVLRMRQRRLRTIIEEETFEMIN